MCKVITVYNQKGGVAKTTSAVNIGIGIAMHDKKVLLIDADAQGDLTKSLLRDSDGEIVEPNTIDYTLSTIMSKIINDEDINLDEGILHHEEGVDILPGNMHLSGLEMTLVNVTFRETVLKEYVNKMRDRYDYIIIDCNPATNMMSTNALFAADSILIPVVTEFIVAMDLEDLLKRISTIRRRFNPDLCIEGILLTIVKKNTNLSKASSEVLKELCGNGIRIFKESVPMSIKAAEAPAFGQSIYKYAPDNGVAKAYMSVSEEVLCDEEGRA